MSKSMESRENRYAALTLKSNYKNNVACCKRLVRHFEFSRFLQKCIDCIVLPWNVTSKFTKKIYEPFVQNHGVLDNFSLINALNQNLHESNLE